MSIYNYTYQCCGKVCTLLDRDIIRLQVPGMWVFYGGNIPEYKICSPSCLVDFAQRYLLTSKEAPSERPTL